MRKEYFINLDEIQVKKRRELVNLIMNITDSFNIFIFEKDNEKLTNKLYTLSTDISRISVVKSTKMANSIKFSGQLTDEIRGIILEGKLWTYKLFDTKGKCIMNVGDYGDCLLDIPSDDVEKLMDIDIPKEFIQEIAQHNDNKGVEVVPFTKEEINDIFQLLDKDKK